MRAALLLSLILPYASTSCMANNADNQKQAAAAVRILESYYQNDSVAGNRNLHVICWTPQGRPFPEIYHSRLNDILKHIQLFYGLEMERNGFGQRSFNLLLDSSGKVIIHSVKGLHPETHYGKQSGNEIRNECKSTLSKAGIDIDHETVVLFCNLANWNPETLRFTHKSPYYAGGNQRSGTAWQLDSSELAIENIPLKQPLISDGEYGRISLGKHNSIFIGGIAHEMGHSLGLPHCRPRPDELVHGTPLMGSGNRTYGDELRGEGRGTFLSFAHALRLASHPQFSESVKGMTTPVSTSVDDIHITTRDRTIHISGNVHGTPPVYGVVAYFDPVGGGDYDSTTATAVPDQHGYFELSCDAFPPGKRAELRIVPLHCNGAVANRNIRSQIEFSYHVSKAGIPDIETAKLRLELSPFLKAINAQDQQEISTQLTSIRSERGKQIAQQLLAPKEQRESPAGYGGDAKSESLTSFRPESAEVGWDRPTYDRVPNPSVLLEAGGEIFEHGIYAHAPARHVYRLGKQWKQLSGRVGIAKGNRGTVVFQIKGDGKLLWESKVIQPNMLESFEVVTTNINHLELITLPTPDGKASDWGLWLSPTLSK